MMVVSAMKPPSLGSSYNPDDYEGRSVIAETLQVGRWQSRTSCLQLVINFLRSNPRTKFGRVMQLIGVVFFAVMATAGIIVQVYTDTDVSKDREQLSVELQELSEVAFELYAISNLLLLEMEPSYEFNRIPYDEFLEKAQALQRSVDTKLTFVEKWPADLSALPEADRANVSSPNALRTAVRAQREARKGINGTNEVDVINFFSLLVDNLATLVRTRTIESLRFSGWREFLSTFYTFQAYINFKKFALVGRKLTREHRTVEVNDPVYLSIVGFYMKYTEFLKILSLTSPFGSLKVANLTETDASKNVERLANAYVLKQDFASLSNDEWTSVMAIQDGNIYWIMQTLQSRVQGAMSYYSRAWSDTAIFSLGFFVAAAVVVFGSILVHFSAAWRIQNQIIESHSTLNLLSETLQLLYDCVPRSFVRHIKTGEIMTVKHCTDACVLIFDMANVPTLMHNLDLDQFLDILTEFYQMVEETLVKYNCCKIDVHGETFALAAGIGERHNVDHVAEMLFIALELHDRAAELELALEEENKKKKKKDESEDPVIRLRMGMHAGTGYARVVNLRVPTVGVFGDVIQIAALLHAASLTKMTHVSADVSRRLSNSTEVDFTKRGFLELGAEKWGRLETYWAAWINETTADNELEDRISMASSLRSSVSEALRRRA